MNTHTCNQEPLMECYKDILVTTNIKQNKKKQNKETLQGKEYDGWGTWCQSFLKLPVLIHIQLITSVPALSYYPYQYFQLLHFSIFLRQVWFWLDTCWQYGLPKLRRGKDRIEREQNLIFLLCIAVRWIGLENTSNKNVFNSGYFDGNL